MRPRPAIVACALSAACATVPEVPLARGGPPRAPAKVDLAPCVLVAERVDRWLVEGTAELSFASWRQAYATIVIRHPAGALVVDPAFGHMVAAEVRRAPFHWQLVVGRARTKTPLLLLLDQAGLT